MQDNAAVPAEGRLIVMAGGGTGGHAIPLIAVAREVVRLGYQVLFVGTERGVESRLVPAAGFRLEKIRVGGIKNLGLLTRISSVWRLVSETAGQIARFGEWKPAAVFSVGGYVAGPPVLAAIMRGVPVVIMEPNAMPGAANRWAARWVKRALINFEATRRFFPEGRTEVTGVPVREEFFRLRPKPDGKFTVLVTGGSLGSRTLNNAAHEAWPLFREAGLPVRLVQQTGTPMYKEMSAAFCTAEIPGEVAEFITDMPGAFAQADLVVCRAGASTTAELAAAGKPSILIPFPFSADNHQQSNAEAFAAAGAARMFLDRDWNARVFFENVREFYQNRELLAAMSAAAQKLAHPGAAQRAAAVVAEVVSGI